MCRISSTRLRVALVVPLALVDGLQIHTEENRSNWHTSITSDTTFESTWLSFDSISKDPDVLYRADSRVSNLSHACMRRFGGLGQEMIDALDNPWLMCASLSTTKGGLRQVPILGNPKKAWDVAVAKARARSIFKRAMPMPALHVDVAPDPLKKRKHIFTIGPESSGTCFIREFLAAAFGHIVPKESANDLTYFRDATTYHVSIPEGCYCEGVTEEPIIDDLGFSPNVDPTKVSGEEGQKLDRRRYPTRYLIDIPALVASYRARGENIRIFQVVRNPEISLISKALRGHCQIDAISRQEQSLAFKFMLGAKDLPEVSTVCYEQIFSEGGKYLKGLLAQSGIKVTDGSMFPDIAPPSTDEEPMVDHRCTDDVKAYMELCPTSPDTMKFKKQCST